jgi:hypothetical protein
MDEITWIIFDFNSLINYYGVDRKGNGLRPLCLLFNPRNRILFSPNILPSWYFAGGNSRIHPPRPPTSIYFFCGGWGRKRKKCENKRDGAKGRGWRGGSAAGRGIIAGGCGGCWAKLGWMACGKDMINGLHKGT